MQKDLKIVKNTVRSSSFLRFQDLFTSKLCVNTLVKLTPGFISVKDKKIILLSFSAADSENNSLDSRLQTSGTSRYQFHLLSCSVLLAINFFATEVKQSRLSELKCTFLFFFFRREYDDEENPRGNRARDQVSISTTSSTYSLQS